MAESYSRQILSGTLASTVGVGTQAWVNPGNAASSDDVYATCAINNQTTVWLTALNFGFAIPATAFVTGVRVEIEKSASGSACLDNKVQLWYSAAAIGNDASSSVAWPTVDGYTLYGGLNYNWGYGFSPTIINDVSFGVGISATSAQNRTVSIDHIAMTVFYNTQITPPTVAGPGPHRNHR